MIKISPIEHAKMNCEYCSKQATTTTKCGKSFMCKSLQ